MSPSQQKPHSISDCSMVMSDLATYNRARERWEATSGLRSIDQRQKLFSVSPSCTRAYECKVVGDHDHNRENMMVSESTILHKAHERLDDDDKFTCCLRGEHSSQRLHDGSDDGGTEVSTKDISGSNGDCFSVASAAPPSSVFKFGEFGDSKTASIINTVTRNQNIGSVLGGSTSKNDRWCNPIEKDGNVVAVRNDGDNYNFEEELQSEDDTTNSSNISSSEREEELAKAFAAFDSVAEGNPAAGEFIGIESFPLLFEKLGTVFCEEEHLNTFKRLQDENGFVARDVFINWYVGWLFGEYDEEDDEFSGEEHNGDRNDAAVLGGDKCGENDEILKSHFSGGFEDSFKLSSGNWKCDSCMVTNSEKDVKCIACETSQGGGISSSTTSDNTSVKSSSNSGGGGLFGGSTSSIHGSSRMDSGTVKYSHIGGSSTGFIFGGGTSTSNSSNGFVFGTSQGEGSPPPAPSSSGFKFSGVDSPKTDVLDVPPPSTDDTTKSKGFVFNISGNVGP